MGENELDAQLKTLGVDFMNAPRPSDAGKTLLEASRNKELRYWEVFPAMLANAAEQGALDQAALVKQAKSGGSEKALEGLVCFSLALFRVRNLQFSWVGLLWEALTPEDHKQVDVYEEALRQGRDVLVDGKALSTERVQTLFERYFKPALDSGDSLNALLVKKEEFGLEYALSQVFSPKQKELFLKKLKGEKFTKTENEYFSRTVRKKVLALANSELHRLARELLK